MAVKKREPEGKTAQVKVPPRPPSRPTVTAVPVQQPPPNPIPLRRSRPKEEPEEIIEDKKVSAGPVDKVIELAFNPTREKIREVTVIDRMQGRLFPQLDMMMKLWHYVIEIASFRENDATFEKLFKHKRPIPPDSQDDLLYGFAQWQKSVAGKNLDRATDIALAETENRAEEDGSGGMGNDPFKE